jgi:hypothetical protein
MIPEIVMVASMISPSSSQPALPIECAEAIAESVRLIRSGAEAAKQDERQALAKYSTVHCEVADVIYVSFFQPMRFYGGRQHIYQFDKSTLKFLGVKSSKGPRQPDKSAVSD